MYGSIDDPASNFSLLPRSSDANDVQQQHAIGHDGLSPGAGKGWGGRLYGRSVVLLAAICGLTGAAVMFATPANMGSIEDSNRGNSRDGFSRIVPRTETAAQSSLSVASRSSAASSPDAPLEFTALNYYHIRDGKPGQGYPWLEDIKLIEPHRETTLAVANAREGFDYRWEVRAGSVAGEGKLLTIAFGAEEATVVLTQLDENVVVLEEVDAAGDVTRRLEETVMVKYVRREIRSLTDEEREEVLDTMHTLWAVSAKDGNGKEQFGDDYADIWAMDRMHFRASSTGRCDQFHNGLNFLVSHSILSNTFEYSMQLVNPKLTLPYWDFTIERSTSRGQVYDKSNPATMSELLHESWFGSADPYDHMVKDGRWAFTTPPRVQTNDPTSIHPDVFNKLRSAWNVNGRPYLTRGLGTMCHVNTQEKYPWPTCETHYDLVTSHDNFYSWVWDATFDPHAPVHLWLGGTLDCKETYTSIGKMVGEETAQQLAYVAGANRLGLYEKGIFKCDGEARPNETAAEMFSSGTCGCLDFDLTQGDDYIVILHNVLFATQLLKDFDTNTQRMVVDRICNTPVALGDHDQSSSSLGPLFWPLHPTLERMWQFSLLTDTVTDLTWPDSDVTITYSDGTSSTEMLSISSQDDVCTGHAGSDVFPYGLLDNDHDNFQVKTGIKNNVVIGNVLTNREVLEALGPRTNMLPYVYDNFEWEHCAVDGYNFDDAWGEDAPTSPGVRSPRFKEGTKPFPQFSYIKKMMAEFGEGLVE